MIWIGCPNVDNEQVYQSIPGNRTFLQGCAVSLAGDDSGPAHRHQGAGSRAYHGGSFAGHDPGLVFVFVLPAAVLVAGAVVVLLRRRR